MALQSIVSRETDPLDSSVISVTQASRIVDLRTTFLLLQLHIRACVNDVALLLLQVDAGKAHNVIPDRVVMGGTVRALNDEWMAHLRQRIEEVCVAAAPGT
jgi:metal-dependent amidase/aminoacylase/carboxypeptidase family protein